MEFMSQYDAKIVYVKGEDNTIADTLSRLPAEVQEQLEHTATYAYAYCLDDLEEDLVAADYPTSGDMAYSVASMLAGLGLLERPVNAVCTTLNITADKSLLQQI